MNESGDINDLKNTNSNIVENSLQNNENESSFEIMNGEEEDEDDLLKSESETNKSSNKHITINNEKNRLNIEEINVKEKIDEKNNDINNNNNDNIKQDGDDDLDAMLKSLMEDKNSQPNNEEKKNDNSNEEEDEEGEEDDDSETEQQINPYQLYLDSNISISNYLSTLKEGDYIYGIKTKIFYVFLKQMPYKKSEYIFIKNQSNEENIRQKLLKDINDVAQENLESETFNKAIKANFYLFIKKLSEKEEIILIKENDCSNFTFNRKIKIHYLNYLNKKYCFEIFININWKLKNFVKYFKKQYHIPNISNNSNITLYLKDKQFSGEDIEKNEEKIFSPQFFNYEEDYIIIIEHESFDIFKIDLGSTEGKYNFKGKQIPHIIFSSYNNFSVDAFLASKQLKTFECDIYIFRDEFYFNIESNVGKNNYEKAIEVLSNLNWKNKCKYITTIKSMKSSKYDNNEDVLSFSIWPKFNLYHDKTYIILVSTPLMNIKVFDSGVGDQGLFIISKDKKAIINGIIGKKLSDFSIDN